MSTIQRAKRLLWIAFAILFLLNCNLIQQTTTAPAPEQEQAAQAAALATGVAATLEQIILPTVTVAPVTATASSTATDVPTATPLPTETPIPTATDTPLTPTASAPTFEEWAQDADILVYEDFLASRWVKQALDDYDYQYVDIADALGNFKNELLSKTWDVVIVAAEFRGAMRGEFFSYLHEQLQQGGTVALETYIIDQGHPRLSNLLDECGIEFQRNYVSDEQRNVVWVHPEHPLLQEPNNEVSAARFREFWFGDIGDVMKRTGTGDAVFVGGTGQDENKGGLLTVCYDDRFILQTFGTHDHRQEEMTKLWQNYVHFLLRARYNYLFSK